MTKSVPAKRKTPEERRDKLMEEDCNRFEQWCEEDKFNNFDELINKVKVMDFGEFVSKVYSDFVLFYKLDIKDIPVIITSVKVLTNVEVLVCLNGCRIPSSKYNWILGNDLLCTRSSMLECLLSHLNGLSTNSSLMTINDKLNNVCNSLSECISELENSNDDKGPLLSKLNFFKEQMVLGICLHPKYSPEFLLWASSIFFPFPGAYSAIRNTSVVTLPHPSYLRRFSVGMKSEGGLKKLQISYLTEKCKLLQPHERIINVLFDEIHVMQKVTYRGGRLEGVTESNDIVNKIQAFMLTSLFSDNEDIIALYPVKTLSACDLKEFTLHILKVLSEAGYTVLTLISDNNRVNRNMFTLLCGGTIQPFITNP